MKPCTVVNRHGYCTQTKEHTHTTRRGKARLRCDDARRGTDTRAEHKVYKRPDLRHTTRHNTCSTSGTHRQCDGGTAGARKVTHKHTNARTHAHTHTRARQQQTPPVRDRYTAHAGGEHVDVPDDHNAPSPRYKTNNTARAAMAAANKQQANTANTANNSKHNKQIQTVGHEPFRAKVGL